MMRLIDADALEEEIRTKDIMGGLNYRSFIRNAPTIEMRRQEPCDDAISINSMVETIATKVTEDAEKFIFETITPYCEEITKREISKKDLKRALTQYFSSGKWIPVSERLPEDRDWCLGIFRELDTGWINPLPFVCDYVRHETKATTKEYWILRGFTDRDKHIDYYFNLECVAWMPLPEPYREGSE